ncbi:hypothetical protein PybrP1_004889 [[Pythium] brassicae (nom. inval.)]|nr:hypothetical protein PybrP1_004889 [[Pythium] brassicae (nom. inval.)]
MRLAQRSHAPQPAHVLLLVFMSLLALSLPASAALFPQWRRLVESFGFHTGFGYQCSYVERPSQSVRSHLQTHLKAQDRAVESIVAAIEAWEFSRSIEKHRTPLVLAITGPTGTGKTETANLLAESLFQRKKKLGNSDKQVSSGLLMFRGEDFGDNFTNPVTEYHRQIKTRLAEHLRECSGNAVVVFDEVQKVIPHTLDVLLEAMSPRAQLSYYKGTSIKAIDTSNVIFVFVSDIGVLEMEQLLIQFEFRSDIPLLKFEKVVKSALDAQWRRLNFGKVIDKVIPFLPFEQEHVAEIIALKLEQLDANYRGIYWHRLWIDPQLSNYMSRLDSMQYEMRSAIVDGRSATTKIFAKYGARNVETGPIQSLKSKLLRSIRPFNPDAEIRISFDVASNRVAITSCAAEAAPDSSGNEFTSVQCTTKWEGSFE